MNFPKICNQILGTIYNTSTDVSTHTNAQQILLPVPVIGLLGQYIYTINRYTPTTATSLHISKVLVHPHYMYTH